MDVNGLAVQFAENVIFINENDNLGNGNGAQTNGDNGIASSSSSDSGELSIPPEAQELFDNWDGVWFNPDAE